MSRADAYLAIGELEGRRLDHRRRASVSVTSHSWRHESHAYDSVRASRVTAIASSVTVPVQFGHTGGTGWGLVIIGVGLGETLTIESNHLVEASRRWRPSDVRGGFVLGRHIGTDVERTTSAKNDAHDCLLCERQILISDGGRSQSGKA